MASKTIILNIKVDAQDNSICDPGCPFRFEAYCRLFGEQLTSDYIPETQVARCQDCVESLN